MLTLTDPRGNTTYFAYPALKYNHAYLTNQTRRDGSTQVTSLYGYDFNTGNRLWALDPRGYNTTYQYDILGRVTQVNYPNALGSVIYAYVDSGNYVDITDASGRKTRQIYDRLGRPSTVEKFLGALPYSNQTTTYNWQDLVASKVDQLGNSTSYQYDYMGRLTKTTKPDGKSTQEYYNDVASWIRLSDEDSNYRCNVYDRLGRLVSVIEKASADCQTGIVTTYSYDQVSDLLKITNALSKSTSYVLNNLGRLTKTSYPDNTIETYTYDNNGNLVNSTDRNGVKTMRNYDSLNRVKTVTYCGTPIAATSYTYDKNGNVLQIQNENATITYIYDPRNRVLNETTAVNLATRTIVDLGCFGTGGTLTRSGGISETYTVGYTYNGELLNTIMYPTTSQSNPDITIKYGYDGLGRVLNVTRASTSTYYARSFTYYKNQQLKGFQFGNGLIANYTYDKISRPLTIKLGGTTTMSLTYSYNNTGTVASVIGTVNGATVNEQYRYDSLQRLTNYTVTSSGSTTTGWYEYDNVGNRLRQKVNSTITVFAYNSVNELTNSTKYSTPLTTTNYSYYSNGNLKTQNVTSSGTVRWTYTWNAANRLVKVTNSTGQALYAYDGTGRMAEAIEGASTWFFSYTGSDILYKYLLNTGNYAYVYDRGMKICVVVNVTWDTYFYHTDALGSTRIITYTDSTYVYVNNYQAFGQDNGRPQGVYQNRATDKFTGKAYSTATGLYYYYQRFYDPSTGRFISPDLSLGRLSNPESLNLYIYVLNRPTSLIDPSGLDWWNPWSWTPQQQAQAFTILVVAIAVVAVVATVVTFGATAPLAVAAIGAAVGAASSSTIYTVTAGDKATLGGAALSALTGAIAGAIGGGAGGLAGSIAVKGAFQFALGAVMAGAGQAIGNQVGDYVSGKLTGQAYHPDWSKIGLDFGIGVFTFGFGAKLGVGRSAENIAANRVYGSVFADPEGAAPLADTIADKGASSSLHPVYMTLKTLVGFGQAGYQALTQVGGDWADLLV
jgi:RHS repeat-associated protein